MLLFVVPLPCAVGLLSLAVSLLVASLSNRWRNTRLRRLGIRRTRGTCEDLRRYVRAMRLALEQVQMSLPEGWDEGKLSRRFKKI